MQITQCLPHRDTRYAKGVHQFAFGWHLLMFLVGAVEDAVTQNFLDLCIQRHRRHLQHRWILLSGFLHISSRSITCYDE
ncbi:hypothetical protein ABW22_11775 [Thiobacillus denitrificans]|uniref:Uncharacterized protein n=1 Tax=Thiobacillus denitrificans TaxID=36861 RepID=A0A106BM62_THIDE|nr:hypothetical protein ABW22_11775 [Thiobacillus denitrificans]